MIKAGIVGSAGYTAGELLRILVNHPFVEVDYAQSTSQHGKKVYEHHHDLQGDLDLEFVKDPHFDVDVLFLCMGHGKSAEFLSKNEVPDGLKIIDLSTDFRDESNDFTYGLPELQADKIAASQKVANPGCFATAIQLGLLPLASNHLLKSEVHANAITGSTGAGASLSETSHFSWRNNNVSVYKPFEHQHLAEITKSIKSMQPDFTQAINFIPVRGNFTRGIMATLYVDYSGNEADALELFEEYYRESAFTFVKNENPALKQVVNTNKCFVYPSVIQGKILVISILDNLIKGASGQAVQNMNLMFGLPEKSGLNLKATGF